MEKYYDKNTMVKYLNVILWFIVTLVKCIIVNYDVNSDF